VIEVLKTVPYTETMSVYDALLYTSIGTMREQNKGRFTKEIEEKYNDLAQIRRTTESGVVGRQQGTSEPSSNSTGTGGDAKSENRGRANESSAESLRASTQNTEGGRASVLSQEEQDSIAWFVEQGGMGIQSLQSLIALTELDMAVRNGDESFTSTVGLGSDGVNNGVASANLLTGVISEKMRLQTGIIPVMENQDIQNMQDVYRTGETDYYVDFGNAMKAALVRWLQKTDYRGKANQDKKWVNAVIQLFPTFDPSNNEALAMRKIAKTWSVPLNYSAGKKALQRALANGFMEGIYKQMSSIANNANKAIKDKDADAYRAEQEKLKKLEALIKDVRNLYGLPRVKDKSGRMVLQQQVIHADETPVTIMRMGDDEKKPKKGYVWAYATTQYNPVQAVIYDFQDSRSGQHAEAFLKEWQGHLICDDYSGYKARFKSGQVIEVGCMAHARRKFHELHVTKKSQIAEQALVLIQKLYAIEAELRKKTDGTAEQRREYRQQHSQPMMQQLYEWLNQHYLTVPSSSPTAKAINYTLKRWSALSRYLDDGNLPICNNWVENQMRPWALGRKNWLFAGSLRSGQRAANIMTLIQSAKLNGLDPYAYLSDVLKRLPTHKVTQIEELLPHRWKPEPN